MFLKFSYIHTYQKGENRIQNPPLTISKGHVLSTTSILFRLNIYWKYKSTKNILHFFSTRMSWWLSGKEFASQCRRCRFNPWVLMISRRRKSHPTLAFLPEKNPMDRGDWRTTVHGVTKSQTWLKQLST